MGMFSTQSGLGHVGHSGIGSNSRGKTVTANTANTKGSWVELITSTEHDTVFITCDLFQTGTTIDDYLLDIGIGAAGSEVVLLPDMSATMDARSLYSWAFPVQVPAGTRISARIQSGISVTTVYVSATLYAGNFLSPPSVGVINTIGENKSDSGGTGIDPGAVSDTKGAWTQITSSLPDDTKGVAFSFGTRDNAVQEDARWGIDIGIGAASSEVVLIPNIWFRSNPAENTSYNSQFYPVDIPAGTRVAARAQCSTTNSIDRLIDIIMHGGF